MRFGGLTRNLGEVEFWLIFADLDVRQTRDLLHPMGAAHPDPSLAQERRSLRMTSGTVFRPSGAGHFHLQTHGLRRGLYSFAASRGLHDLAAHG